jgi:acetoin utilization deacetylase AcuC-like enzyme
MYIMNVPVFYSPVYVVAARNFETTRKAGWVADSLTAVELTEPSPLTEREIEAVHDHAYVEAVRTGQPRELAASSGLGWDARVWDAVCSSNGGAVAGSLHAWRSRAHAGSLSSGLHHASAERGKGFCTFNGLALAAHALMEDGANNVLILDLDAHCGGGTHKIVCEWPAIVHLDISVDDFDRYAPSVTGHSTLDLITETSDYLTTLRDRLSALGEVAFDVVIYNAGMDVDERCPLGGLAGITLATLAQREQIVFEWARAREVPVAFVLAGGYLGPHLSQDELVELHLLTIAAAALANSGAALTVDSICDFDFVGRGPEGPQTMRTSPAGTR